MSKFVDVLWFNGGIGCCGIVKCIDDHTDEVKYYIGAVDGFLAEEDIERIMSWGAKFPKEAGDLLWKV